MTKVGVDPDEAGDSDMNASLFQRFADAGLWQGLAKVHCRARHCPIVVVGTADEENPADVVYHNKKPGRGLGLRRVAGGDMVSTYLGAGTDQRTSVRPASLACTRSVRMSRQPWPVG